LLAKLANSFTNEERALGLYVKSHLRLFLVAAISA